MWGKHRPNNFYLKPRKRREAIPAPVHPQVQSSPFSSPPTPVTPQPKGRWPHTTAGPVVTHGCPSSSTSSPPRDQTLHSEQSPTLSEAALGPRGCQSVCPEGQGHSPHRPHPRPFLWIWGGAEASEGSPNYCQVKPCRSPLPAPRLALHALVAAPGHRLRLPPRHLPRSPGRSIRSGTFSTAGATGCRASAPAMTTLLLSEDSSPALPFCSFLAGTVSRGGRRRAESADVGVRAGQARRVFS